METGATVDAAPDGGLVVQPLQSLPNWDCFNGAYEPHRIELPLHLLDALSPAEREIWANKLALAADNLSDTGPRSAFYLRLNAGHFYRSINRTQDAVRQETRALELQQLLAEGKQIAAIAHRLTDDLAGESAMSVSTEAAIVSQIGLAMLHWGDIPQALVQFTKAHDLYDECLTGSASTLSIADIVRRDLMVQCQIACCEGHSPSSKIWRRELTRLQRICETQVSRSWFANAGACLLLQARMCVQHSEFGRADERLREFRTAIGRAAGRWARIECDLLQACVLKGRGHDSNAGELALATYHEMESRYARIPIIPMIIPPSADSAYSPLLLLGRHQPEAQRLSVELGRQEFPIKTHTIEAIGDGLQQREVQRHGLRAQRIVYVELLRDGKFSGRKRIPRSEAIKLRDSLRSEPLCCIVDELKPRYTATDGSGKLKKDKKLGKLAPTRSQLLRILGDNIENGEITMRTLRTELGRLGHVAITSEHCSVLINRLKDVLGQELGRVAVGNRMNDAYAINQKGWTYLEIRLRPSRRNSRLITAAVY